ncbi:TPA: hypothetical protein ACGR1G_001585 [Escherichia coli]
MNQEVLTSRAAKSSVQIGLYAASFLANFMKRYLLAAQNKEQFLIPYIPGYCTTEFKALLLPQQTTPI